jgi:hypothetical protein
MHTGSMLRPSIASLRANHDLKSPRAQKDDPKLPTSQIQLELAEGRIRELERDLRAARHAADQAEARARERSREIHRLCRAIAALVEESRDSASAN